MGWAKYDEDNREINEDRWFMRENYNGSSANNYKNNDPQKTNEQRIYNTGSNRSQQPWWY